MSTSGTNLCYEFDGFRVEAGERCLWHGSDLVPLTAKAFDTLMVLIENNGRLVGKDTLLNTVWAETFVEESTLAQNISTLRKALGGRENGTQFIETIPRRGYRFLRDVRRVEDRDDLYVIETRSSTRVIAEKTEVYDSPSPPKVFGYVARHQTGVLAALLVCVMVAAAGFIAVRQYRAGARLPFAQIETRSLVATGDISLMALSRDGKYITLVETKNELQSLTVRQTNSSSSIEVIPPSADQYVGLSFSPDGEAIYYTAYPTPATRTDATTKMGVLYRVPVLGGIRSEIVKDIDSPVALSPDGKMLAFIRQILPERRSVVVTREAAPEASTERILATRPMKERFSPATLAWSPDGKSLAAAVFSGRDPARAVDVVTIDAISGEQRVLTRDPWMWVGQIAWLSDSGSIVFPAYSGVSPNVTDEIWLVTVGDGTTRRVTDGVNGVYGVSVMADSTAIAAVRSTRVSSLWVDRPGDAGAAGIISKSFGDSSLGTLGMDWTPTGKIVYSTAMNGNADIWMVNADGTDGRQLTDDPRADFSPVASRDGKFVVFISNRSGSNSVWRVNLDGTGMARIATVRDASSPSLSPDGQWVYFSAMDDKARAVVLWRVSTSGGEVSQLTERACILPQISPDGQSVMCYYPKKIDTGAFAGVPRPTVLSAVGETVVTQFGDLDSLKQTPLKWTGDGSGFSFALTSRGVSNIWVQKLAGGPPVQATVFKTDEIFRYSWSADGKMLAFEKGLRMNDVLLIRDKGQ